MEETRAIVARFPALELDIRRLCGRDDTFRSVCADYQEAATAFLRWSTIAGEGDGKVEGYRSLVGELEAEILSELKKSGASSQPSDRTDDNAFHGGENDRAK